MAILNVVLGAVLFAGDFVLNGWRGVASLLVALAGCIVLCGQSVSFSTKPMKLSTCVNWMDCSLIVLVLFTTYLVAKGMPVVWMLPVALGAVAAVLGLVCFRAGGSLSPAGWGFLAGVLAVLGLIAWLLMRYVATNAGRGLVTLWNWLLAGLPFLGSVLNRFMAFLASLMPAQEPEDLSALAESGSSAGDVTVEMPTVHIPGFIYVLIALAVIVILVLVIRYLRRFKTGGTRKTVARVQTVKRRRPSLGSALKARLAWLREGLRLWLYLSRHRDTALGMFYELTRLADRSGWRRGISKTPRAFLEELGQRAAGDPELQQAFAQLADAVDAALFAPDQRNISCPQAAVLRRGRKMLLRFRREAARQARRERRAVRNEERAKRAARQQEAQPD